MKKIPYGIQDIEKVITGEYIYIDKTKYIEVLENISEDYQIFLRPRKFGKTLFLDSLDKYYDVNYKEKFDSVFGELYIGKNPTKKKSSYYTLTFNFSGLSTETKEILKYDFKNKVYNSLNKFVKKYNLSIELDKNIKEPVTLLNNFIKAYEQLNIDRKIMVLIDEYDHFANELLSFRFNEFKEVVGKTGFVRKFYEGIKEGAQSVIDRIFITGIAPITLDSVTSGFNIGTNLSMKAETNEMLGFTEEEVLKTLDECGIDRKNIEDMKYSYNGYMFSENGKERVYNSDMVLYFLKEYMRKVEKPQEIIDTNIASDYKKMENMMRLSPKSQEIIDEIIEKDSIIGDLVQIFNMERDQKKEDTITLLFYLGYLTINENTFRGYKLVIPNYVMKKLFYESFGNYISREIKEYAETTDINKSIGELIEFGNIMPLLNLTEEVLEALSNRDFMNFDEKHLKAIMMSYLIKSSWYYVDSEYEVNKGYIDILLTRRYDKVPYEAMIELKYLKKKDSYKAEEKGQIIEEGKRQLYRYLKNRKMGDRVNMKKFVILCVGSKFEIVEEV